MTTVEEEMKKNPELKKSDLDMLRNWHKKQPHLPPMSDSELILFLHSNYYRIEPTKSTIDTYFTVKTHVPEIFSKRDPFDSKELREIMKVVCCVPLPSTTQEGYKVMYVKLIDFDPSHYVFVDAGKILFMVMELWLWTTGASPGHIIIIDMEGTVFGHLARLSPMVMKKFLYYLQEAIPLRLKGIHYMNAVPFVDMFLNLAKPFMKKELMEMLFFHSDLTSLGKKIPVDILPNEQGGKAGSYKDLWAAQIKQVEEHRAWFQQEETRKVNEAIRPGKAKNATDIFGVEGSFKKLDID